MWSTQRSAFAPAVRPPGKLGNAMYFVFQDDLVLCVAPEDGGLWRPMEVGEFCSLDAEVLTEQYLGKHGEHHCLAAAVRLRDEYRDDYSLCRLRDLFHRIEPVHFSLVGRAFQVLCWHRDHQFCGRCGAAMEHHGSDRAMRCPRCDLVSYPRLSPSMIVLVRRGDRALLARNSQWPRGFFSTLAGFIEPGESVEEAVHREVFEEVGILVTGIRYLGSQSWPFPHSLMLGFHAEYESGDLHFRDGEIAEAYWFDVAKLPGIPPPSSISRWLIDAWLQDIQAPAP